VKKICVSSLGCVVALLLFRGILLGVECIELT
jgi:hypothetical protein